MRSDDRGATFLDSVDQQGTESCGYLEQFISVIKKQCFGKFA